MGFTVQYIDLELTQAVDFGSACAGAGGLGGCVAVTTGNDGQAKLTADDWGWGYNLGLTYHATEATRLGLAYRSKNSHHLTGKGKFRVPTDSETLATLADFVDGRISGDVDLALNHRLAGEYEGSVDILSVQVSYLF